MTSSLGRDAITAIVAAGQPPVMVTEYMPGGAGCQVINTATTGTVYLGTSSNIQPAQGVPVPAGSSVQWVEPGQMWAVAGPDVIAPVTITTTDRISSWAPSPEVVALAVAEQLITNGLPINGRADLLDTVGFQAMPTGVIPFATAPYEVAKYASVILTIAFKSPTTTDVAHGMLQWLPPDNGTLQPPIFTDDFTSWCGASANGVGGTVITIIAPVKSPQLALAVANMVAARGTFAYTLIGSSLAVDKITYVTGANGGGVLLADPGPTIPASSTKTYYLDPVSDPLYYVFTLTGSNNIAIVFGEMVNAGALIEARVLSAAFTNNLSPTTRVLASGIAMRCTVQNATAVTAVYSAYIGR